MTLSRNALHAFRLALGAAVFLCVPSAQGADATPQLAAPAATASPAPTASPDVYAPPWKKDGEEFPSYATFRDELVAVLRQARKRVAVVTPLLSDGDIATSLFAARMRGLATLALLDARSSRGYASRHDYLARTQVPTWLVALETFRTDAPSLVVIDDTAWRVSARFDESAAGPVRVDPAALTPEEIFSWQNVRGARFAQDKSLPTGIGSGAKKPTRSRGPQEPGSVTIEQDKAQKQSGNRLPRRLPRETRLQRLKRGTQEQERSDRSTGSLKVPAPPPNESDAASE